MLEDTDVKVLGGCPVDGCDGYRLSDPGYMLPDGTHKTWCTGECGFARTADGVTEAEPPAKQNA